LTFLQLHVLLWLCGAAMLVWIVPGRFARWAIALTTAAFLGVYAPVSLVLLLMSSAITVALARRSSSAAVLWSGVSLMAMLLAWFKLGGLFPAIVPRRIFQEAVPLGLSYYTFRQIHYLFERMKNRLPEHGLLDFLAYMFFLPTLMVGPINLFGDFARDLNRRRFDGAMLSRGLERVLFGYAKIVILGNYVASFLVAKAIFKVQAGNPALAQYLDCLRHGANLYFQFSGYCDVAIGFAAVMGFRIVENFHYPFIARNINDFWNRWHMSLSSFCRHYVFTPVASAMRLPYVAILVSMLVLALWHEFSLRYVAWGVYHGAGIALWQVFNAHRHRLPGPGGPVGKALVQALSIFVTLNFVIVGFIFTKEPDLPAAGAAFLRLLGLEG